MSSRSSGNKMTGKTSSIIRVVALVVALLSSSPLYVSLQATSDVYGNHNRISSSSRNLIALHDNAIQPTVPPEEVGSAESGVTMSRESRGRKSHQPAPFHIVFIADTEMPVDNSHSMGNSSSTPSPMTSDTPPNNWTIAENGIEKAFSDVQQTLAIPGGIARFSSPSAEEKNFSYVLSRTGPYIPHSRIKFVYSCQDRRKTPREQLDRYFGFNTHLETTLNLLIMGDSLAVELGKGMQLAGGAAEGPLLLEHVRMSKTDARELETLSAVTVRGGGTIAYWRVLEFWLKRYIGKRLPNFGRGWLPSYGESLLNHTRQHAQHEKFDVLIFRTSHPWVKANQVKAQFLEATVRMAKEVLGVETTILLTSPVNNNVMTLEELIEFREMNQRIRDFASSSAEADVRLCDMARYVDEVIQYNAKEGLGGNFSEPVFLHKLKVRVPANKKPFAPSIAQLCAERVPDGARTCEKNSYSNDGLHLCMETLGPRLYAAIGCLIQCSRHDRTCEAACNQKFMSLEPISRIYPIDRNASPVS